MRIRVGKNIFFNLTVNRLDDEPEDFTDARNVRLTVNRKYSSYQVKPPLTIHDNIISFEFVGGGNAISGQYEIHLYYEKPNEASVTGVDKLFLDFCNAFILVDLTCKEDTEFERETPSINLKGVIDRNRDGKDGVTPSIDPGTKHWMIGDVDTGVVAEGKDGLTPFIGENGNWWIGDVDTGKPSRGKAFEYSDFTEEEIEELQRPANEMILELNETNNVVKDNERKRIEDEKTRVSSESDREEAENLRKSAEGTRASNEEARETAETGRASAEDNRVKAEQARVEAESNRVKAENTRVEKESERQTAENTRDTNERSREQAETNRVTAEEGRVTEFNRLKSESETATQNATTQANYAKEQGDNVAGTVEEIKTAQSSLLTRVNDYMYDMSGLLGKLAYRDGVGQVISDWNNAEHGYLNSNGEFVANENNRVLYVNIDKDSVYRIYNKNLSSAGTLCLYDTNDELIKIVQTLSSNGYYTFVGAAKVGVSIFLSSINNVSITQYTIQDLTTVLNTQQGNRALYVAAGAVYNEQTGFYELNGLTDITEEQMRTIYNACSGNPNISSLGERYSFARFRTNFRFKDNFGIWIGGVDTINLCYSCPFLEVFAVSSLNNTIFTGSWSRMFYNCAKLREVIGVISIAGGKTVSSPFGGCVLLEKVKIKGIQVNVSFSDSPLLNLESLQYLINNAANTSAITVTVHADVYAKIQDETQTAWHALIEAAAAKQITFATA